MPHLYNLEYGDGSYYVGSARDLATRLEQHAAGLGGAYTTKRQPVKLVFAQEFERIDGAYAREKQAQGWSRAKRLDPQSRGSTRKGGSTREDGATRGPGFG